MRAIKATLLLFLLVCLTAAGQDQSIKRFIGLRGAGPPTAGQVKAADWAARVVTNGGAQPSNGSIAAYAACWDSMLAHNLTGSIYCFNGFAPDSLTAAITPFVKGVSANDPWVNHNFVSGDLTINGLAGNGSNKYLEPGITPGVTGPPILTATSAGLAIYVATDDATSSQCEAGVYGAGFDSFFGMYLHYNTTLTFAGAWSYQTAGTDYVTWTVPSPAAGFYSMQRTSSTTLNLYFYNSGHAHSSLAVTSGAQHGTTDSYPIWVFAADNVGAAQDFSKKRLSAFVLMTSLSSSDDSNLASDIQALRVAFGGGYQ